MVRVLSIGSVWRTELWNSDFNMHIYHGTEERFRTESVNPLTNAWQENGVVFMPRIKNKIISACLHWDPHLFSAGGFCLHTVWNWNQHLYGLGNSAVFDAMRGLRVDSSVTLNNFRIKLNSAWNRSCLYLKTLGQIIRILTTTTLPTEKRKWCLKWFVGNCHPINHTKRPEFI